MEAKKRRQSKIVFEVNSLKPTMKQYIFFMIQGSEARDCSDHITKLLDGEQVRMDRELT